MLRYLIILMIALNSYATSAEINRNLDLHLSKKSKKLKKKPKKKKFIRKNKKLKSKRGTFRVGVQGYYSQWDSGLLNLGLFTYEKALIKEFNFDSTLLANLFTFDITIKNPRSTGTLLGPIFSYTSEDGLWEHRLHAMWFGSYSTKVEAIATISVPAFSFTKYYDLTTEAKINNKVLDFQTRKKISGDFSVFGGYKYFSFSTDLTTTYSIDLSPVPATFSKQLELYFRSSMHVPYIGAGFDAPLSKSFSTAVNLSLGVVAHGSSSKKVLVDGVLKDDELFKPEFAYLISADAHLTYSLLETLDLELGYLIRRFTLKVKDVDLDVDGEKDDKGDFNETFHGALLRAILVF